MVSAADERGAAERGGGGGGGQGAAGGTIYSLMNARSGGRNITVFILPRRPLRRAPSWGGGVKTEGSGARAGGRGRGFTGRGEGHRTGRDIAGKDCAIVGRGGVKRNLCRRW